MATALEATGDYRVLRRLRAFDPVASRIRHMSSAAIIATTAKGTSQGASDSSAELAVQELTGPGGTTPRILYGRALSIF
ncbi:hypothetical protein [Bradyrhizobium japonicum]|uniref:hypothetical protein n=1 Tax=Bradyrhizobium japonicum TaxID=375 RepID=UPI003B679E73